MSDRPIPIESDVDFGKRKWFCWVPTSMQWLVKAEQKILSVVKCRLVKYYVRIWGNSAVLWTIAANVECRNRAPLVLVHGFGGGVALWCLNLDGLSRDRTVYAFDVLGFGRSSRVSFPKDPEVIEKKFVESIDEWRKANKIEKFHLVGHSFGGFLVGCYALEHPDRVKSLIFADPWGFPVYEVDKSNSELVRWGKTLQRVLTPLNPLSADKTSTPWERPQWLEDLVKACGPFTPFSLIRAAGPLGPSALKNLRKDYYRRFAAFDAGFQEAVVEYLFHCNAAKPSGEVAFSRLNKEMNFSCVPMVLRITSLKRDIPVTFIYGSNSWVKPDSGYLTQQRLTSNDVSVYVISDAGHHVYTKVSEFNSIVNERCLNFD